MTDEEAIEHLVARGKSVILNCHFGFGVRVEEGDDGRAHIRVHQELQPRGPAEREMMRETALVWLMATAQPANRLC